MQDFLTDYWDTLVFVEGAIYQMDEDNEGLTAQLTGDAPQSTAGGRSRLCHTVMRHQVLRCAGEFTQSIVRSLCVGSDGQAWSTLLAVLRSLSLLDDRVQAELNQVMPHAQHPCTYSCAQSISSS